MGSIGYEDLQQQMECLIRSFDLNGLTCDVPPVGARVKL